jgi:hypothetical protein
MMEGALLQDYSFSWNVLFRSPTFRAAGVIMAVL